MTEQDRIAQQALVSIAAFVALSNLDERDLDLWLGELRGVLQECKRASHTLSAVRNTAHALCDAARGCRNGPLRALHSAVRDYYAIQAGSRVEAFHELKRVSA